MIRFITDMPQSGPMNMAIDETLTMSLLDSASAGSGFLRFYQWSPPTMSFGYNQAIEKLIDVEKAVESGFGLVRRMSGGKMVFHSCEWTFSLGLPQTILKTENRATFLSMFVTAIEPMVNALVAMKIPAQFADNRQQKITSANSVHCYAAAAGHSVFANGKKLIGAAGVAKSDFLIIHGSIPIEISHPPDHLFHTVKKIDEGVSMTCLSSFLSSIDISLLPTRIA
ncbi:MAG: lipoate--protein ligase family protein, partial [Candidatus Rifleibacteriota bacterium]